MMDREPFTTPPREIDRWPSLVAVLAAIKAPMRRIWQVDPRRVSPRTWHWLTSGYGPPWQKERQ